MSIDPSLNPYASPQIAEGWSDSLKPRRPFPKYVAIVLIADFVLLALRAVAVAAGAYFIATLAIDWEAADYWEVGTGLAIVLTGVAANSVMLARQQWGVWLALLKLASVAASLGVGIWNATIKFSEIEPGTPEFVGAVIGMIIAMGARLALNGVYLWAVFQFWQWAREEAA